MINSNNFVNLIGHLGAHPVAKTLPSGSIVTEFNLATSSRYTDRDGNRVERTEWHRVKAFGKSAELLDQYLRKGSQVSILGSIQYNKWTDKHDQPRTSTDIVVQSFRFLDNNRTPTRPTDPSYAGEPDKRTIARHQADQQRKEQSVDESTMPDANQKVPF